jgi:hypothetical protein
MRALPEAPSQPARAMVPILPASVAGYQTRENNLRGLGLCDAGNLKQRRRGQFELMPIMA